MRGVSDFKVYGYKVIKQHFVEKVSKDGLSSNIQFIVKIFEMKRRKGKKIHFTRRGFKSRILNKTSFILVNPHQTSRHILGELMKEWGSLIKIYLYWFHHYNRLWIWHCKFFQLTCRLKLCNLQEIHAFDPSLKCLLSLSKSTWQAFWICWQPPIKKKIIETQNSQYQA